MVTKLICTNQTAFPVCVLMHAYNSTPVTVALARLCFSLSLSSKPVIPMKKKSTAGLAPNGELSGCLSQLGGWNQLGIIILFALRACHTMAGKPRA